MVLYVELKSDLAAECDLAFFDAIVFRAILILKNQNILYYRPVRLPVLTFSIHYLKLFHFCWLYKSKKYQVFESGQEQFS